MKLYWVRNTKDNRPIVLRYDAHHTNVNNAAKEIFNGRHKPYFKMETTKFDPVKDVLLHDGGYEGLESFNRDELQEESED